MIQSLSTFQDIAELWPQEQRNDALTKHFGAIFIVNLDRSTHRLANVVKEAFCNIGAPNKIERFSAVDGAKIDSYAFTSPTGKRLDYHSHFKHHMRQNPHAREAYVNHHRFYLGRIGCTLSHLEVLKEAKRRGLKSVLIMEDDARFLPGSGKILDEVMNKELPDDWQVLYLYGIENENNSTVKMPGKPHLKRTVKHFWTTTCYAVHNGAYDKIIKELEKLLNGNERPCPTVDEVYGWYLQTDKKSKWYAINPFIVDTSNEPSTLQVADPLSAYIKSYPAIAIHLNDYLEFSLFNTPKKRTDQVTLFKKCQFKNLQTKMGKTIAKVSQISKYLGTKWFEKAKDITEGELRREFTAQIEALVSDITNSLHKKSFLLFTGPNSALLDTDALRSKDYSFDVKYEDAKAIGTDLLQEKTLTDSHYERMSPQQAKVLYDGMQVIHEIFTGEGIEYVLEGDSLLGAVRHQGLIPWICCGSVAYKLMSMSTSIYSRFKDRGYDVTHTFFGFKITPKKLLKGSYTPSIDLYAFTESRGKYILTYEAARKTWEKISFSVVDFQQRVLARFGPYQLSIPKKPESYLEAIYGKEWKLEAHRFWNHEKGYAYTVRKVRLLDNNPAPYLQEK